MNMRVRVDQVLDVMHTSSHRSTWSYPCFSTCFADVRGVVRHLVHHLAVGRAEPQVVLEEVAVRVDVGDHQLLVDQRVGLLQVGVARVVVDHHLVDAAEPVVVLLAELFVLHPEPPVRVPLGEPAVGGDLVHLLVVAHLEHDGKKSSPYARARSRICFLAASSSSGTG
jgi:hypothetical protein